MPERLADLGRRLIADAELRRAATVFFGAAREAHVSAAPLKGLVVSAALYADPLERPFGDVDVLVSRRDVPRVKEFAARRGFGLVHDSRQLGRVNVVIPPGIPIDVRSSMGPPLWSPLTATRILERAGERSDPGICGVPVLWLQEHDHLLFMIVDAFIDKLTSRVDVRAADLTLALRAWVPSVREFVVHVRAAGLSVVAHLVLKWHGKRTGDELALRVVDGLEPLPKPAAHLARWMEGEFAGNPHGSGSRVAARFLADEPLRGLAALGLDAVGTVVHHLRARRSRSWRGRIWRGPGASKGSREEARASSSDDE